MRILVSKTCSPKASRSFSSMPFDSLLPSHRVMSMPLTFTNGLSLRFTILMKSVIMVSPLKGKTSETRGMMMSVEAVKALRVMRPKEGGQSKRT